ncbi:MAG: GNAT family N-acetyltransferase [Polycyclovorans sp.]
MRRPCCSAEAIHDPGLPTLWLGAVALQRQGARLPASIGRTNAFIRVYEASPSSATGPRAGFRLVADGGDELLGFIAYTDDGHIDLLYTAPGTPRRGVATALYRAAEAALRGCGVRELYTEASLVAQPFFVVQGFCVVEEQQVERRGVKFRRFAMRKRIARHA